MSLIRATLLFSSATLLSRVSGYLRDGAMAYFFGASPFAAAFFTSFRFAHFFRRFLGESSLSPLMHKWHHEGEVDLIALWNSFTAIAAIVTVVMEMISGLAYLFFPSEFLILLMGSLPGFFFIVLYGFNFATLQRRGSFFRLGIAPVLGNVVWIIGIVLTYFSGYKLVLPLSVSLGCAIQWISTGIPWEKKWALRFLPLEKAKQVMREILHTVVGVGAQQLLSLSDMTIASIVSPAGPALLWYAQRLAQLPLSLVGVSLGQAVVTEAARKGKEEIALVWKNACRATIFSLLPVTMLILLAGELAVSLLFERGAFDHAASIQSAAPLLWYGLGLIPASLSVISAQLAIFLGFAKNSSSIAAIAVGINICSSALFGVIFGLEGIAIASSIASIFQLIFLSKMLSLPIPFCRDLLMQNAIAYTAAALIANPYGKIAVFSIVWGISGVVLNISEMKRLRRRRRGLVAEPK